MYQGEQTFHFKSVETSGYTSRGLVDGEMPQMQLDVNGFDDFLDGLDVDRILDRKKVEGRHILSAIKNPF